MRLYNVTFDAYDPIRLSSFWSAVLERPVSDGANDHVAIIERTAFEPALLFLRVPEDKVAKNRLHLDLDCEELESARRSLKGLGATSSMRRMSTACPG